MNLVRSWMGQALRATGAAIVIPVAILVALSLSSIGGAGLGGLGSLGQIVSGPAVAGSQVSVEDGDSEISQAVTELAASQPLDSGSGSSRSSSPSGPGGSGGGAGEGGGSLGGGGTGGGGGNGGSGVEGGGNGGGGGDNGGGGSEPGPPEPPGGGGTVDSVGETVKDVTKDTPVAPTVEDAVDTLTDVCGQLSCP